MKQLGCGEFRDYSEMCDQSHSFFTHGNTAGLGSHSQGIAVHHQPLLRVRQALIWSRTREANRKALLLANPAATVDMEVASSGGVAVEEATFLAVLSKMLHGEEESEEIVLGICIDKKTT
uniref:Uncharacterized protein n=1 Tax=Oryza brachyantha TaxID=4533 RepID=J3KUP4_ORYBR